MKTLCLEHVVRSALAEQQSGVVDVGDVQHPIALGAGGLDQQIHNTVGDR